MQVCDGCDECVCKCMMGVSVQEVYVCACEC